MDPTKALAEIRELVTHDDPAEVAEPIIERVTGLDEWITKGGFLPEQWNRPVGRPRRTEDGVVLKGVVHGKRSSYNKGCRCVPCTEANRDAAARQRQRAQQSKEK